MIKVSVQQEVPVFNPVTVSITFDSLKKLSVFASLFNTCKVTDLIASLGGFSSQESIEITSEINNKTGVSNNEFVSKIANRL